MSVVRFLGLCMATAMSVLMVVGAIGLVFLDFARSSQNTPIGSADNVPDDPVPSEEESRRGDLIGRLEQMRDLTFFEEKKVPGSDITIMTGTAYRSVENLLADKFERQWCYVHHGIAGSAFGNRVDLGSRNGTNSPKYVSADDIAEDQAALFDLTPNELAAYARIYCKLDLASSSD